MAAEFKVLHGQTRTSAGSIVLTGAGFAPKAAVFLYDAAVAGAAAVVNFELSIGAAVDGNGNEPYCASANFALDGAGTADTQSRGQTLLDAAFGRTGALGIIFGVTVTSWDADGITLNQDAADTAVHDFAVLLFGGDIDAHLHNQESTNGGVAVPVTTGFLPDVIIAFKSHQQFNAGSTAGGGMWSRTADTGFPGVFQHVDNWWNRDGQGTMQLRGHRSDNYALANADGSGSRTELWQITNPIATGYTLTDTSARASGANETRGFLALGFQGGAWEMRRRLVPSGTGTLSQAVPFDPAGAFIFANAGNAPVNDLRQDGQADSGSSAQYFEAGSDSFCGSHNHGQHGTGTNVAARSSQKDDKRITILANDNSVGFTADVAYVGGNWEFTYNNTYAHDVSLLTLAFEGAVGPPVFDSDVVADAQEATLAATALNISDVDVTVVADAQEATLAASAVNIKPTFDSSVGADSQAAELAATAINTPAAGTFAADAQMVSDEATLSATATNIPAPKDTVVVAVAQAAASQSASSWFVPAVFMTSVNAQSDEALLAAAASTENVFGAVATAASSSAVLRAVAFLDPTDDVGILLGGVLHRPQLRGKVKINDST